MFKEVRTAVKLREGGGTGNTRRTLVGVLEVVATWLDLGEATRRYTHVNNQ